MSEKWLPVVGYEGTYEVSDQGQVRSVDRIVFRGETAVRRKGVVLKPTIHPQRGVRQVSLQTSAGKRTARVHKLLMEAFVGPCPDGQEVLHWDDNPANNTLPNLRYGTRSENVRDRIRNGRHNFANATHCKQNHLFSTENTYLRLNGGRACRACKRVADRRRRRRSTALVGVANYGV